MTGTPPPPPETPLKPPMARMSVSVKRVTLYSQVATIPQLSQCYTVTALLKQVMSGDDPGGGGGGGGGVDWVSSHPPKSLNVNET